MSRYPAAPVPLIDWGKAIASQLIVWHHLVIYGPMARMAEPWAPDVFAWLADSARLVVQIFLVSGGFLAARTLMPGPGQAGAVRWSGLADLGARRYWRLAKPVLGALVLAVLCAALARELMDHPDTPAAPTWPQLLANALLLQDVLGEPALSAGLWYAAIDLQLFVLLAVLSAAVGASGLQGRAREALAVLGLLGGMLLALLWLNRIASFDRWGPYFFGSYGLGVLAFWVRQQARRTVPLLLMAALVGLALWVEWRTRLALAGVIAVWLASGLGVGLDAVAWLNRPVKWLSRVSYEVFLVHYPVSLLVSAVVYSQWPDSLGINTAGLLLAWGGSLAVGAGLHHGLNRRPVRQSVPRGLPA
jgi:peptidoglycan/LPS O-acetylase OafA/YrhL